MYEYVEELPESYKIEYFKEGKSVELTIYEAIKIFLKRYAEPNCKPWTFKTYVSIFKTNIIPYFKDGLLNDLDLDAVLDYYIWLKKKKLSPQRTKIQWRY